DILMTFFRETWRLLSCAAAATIAGSAFIAAPAHAATVNFGNCTSGGAYSNVAVDGNGNFTITCQGANSPGTIAFSPTTYTGNTSSTVTVSLTHNDGSTGSASSSVAVTSGGCVV